MNAEQTIRLARESAEKRAEKERQDEAKAKADKDAAEFQHRIGIADTLNDVYSEKLFPLGVSIVPANFGQWGLWIKIETCVPIEVEVKRNVDRIDGFRVGWRNYFGYEGDLRPFIRNLDDAICLAHERFEEIERVTGIEPGNDTQATTPAPTIEDRLINVLRDFVQQYLDSASYASPPIAKKIEWASDARVFGGRS